MYVCPFVGLRLDGVMVERPIQSGGEPHALQNLADFGEAVFRSMVQF